MSLCMVNYDEAGPASSVEPHMAVDQNMMRLQLSSYVRHLIGCRT